MLSLTSEYALRAIMHLAALPPDQSINSQRLAARTKVPHGYLSKVMRDLVVAGLVLSRRGPQGGFSLAKQQRLISILDVLSAVDPIQRLTRCPLGNPAHVGLCPLHRRLDDAIAIIEAQFARTSIAEILAAGAPADCNKLVQLTARGKH